MSYSPTRSCPDPLTRPPRQLFPGLAQSAAACDAARWGVYTGYALRLQDHPSGPFASVPVTQRPPARLYTAAPQWSFTAGAPQTLLLPPPSCSSSALLLPFYPGRPPHPLTKTIRLVSQDLTAGSDKGLATNVVVAAPSLIHMIAGPSPGTQIQDTTLVGLYALVS